MTQKSEASSTGENFPWYAAFMVLLENYEGNQSKVVLLRSSIAAVQVMLLFSVSQVLTICLCVNMNEKGSPPDPGSALLRPAKNHSET